jgi:hypothetical protein
MTCSRRCSRGSGRARGYSLTHTDLTGTNAFFVRDGYAALFPEIKALRIRGPNLWLRSEGHRPSERQAVFAEVPEQRANEEPMADCDAGVQRVVATGLGPLLFPATDRVIAACIRDAGVWQPDELDWLKTHVPR